MPIDGCEHSFHELANEVLPGYMSTLRVKMAHPMSMSKFGVKGVGPVALQRKLELHKDPSACYVLMDEGRPIYVGISKGVIARLRDHVLGSDQFVATLAYKIAAAKYPHTLTASGKLTVKARFFSTIRPKEVIWDSSIKRASS